MGARRVVRVAAWATFALLACAPIALALTAPKLADLPPAAPEGVRSSYVTLTGEERGMRKTAAKGFPTDPWSQDDDFHNQEWRRVQTLASNLRGSRQSVLQGLDDGMREGWWRSPKAEVRVTVPPCRPRPIY